MLPERSCIIHAARHPLDAALSCFAQPFAHYAAVPWSWDLEDIAAEVRGLRGISSGMLRGYMFAVPCLHTSPLVACVGSVKRPALGPSALRSSPKACRPQTLLPRSTLNPPPPPPPPPARNHMGPGRPLGGRRPRPRPHAPLRRPGRPPRGGRVRGAARVPPRAGVRTPDAEVPRGGLYARPGRAHREPGAGAAGPGAAASGGAARAALSAAALPAVLPSRASVAELHPARARRCGARCTTRRSPDGGGTGRSSRPCARASDGSWTITRRGWRRSRRGGALTLEGTACALARGGQRSTKSSDLHRSE
jgi:hypothetical protein